jgi:hypothetical protein
MSIVKQLIDLAGGTIDVRSDLGRGTQVKLGLPLENRLGPSGDETATPISPSVSSEDPISIVRYRAQGRTVSLQGFDTYSEAVSLQSQSLASLKASIQKYICDWFNLRIISSEPSSGAAADIVISDDSAFLNPSSIVGNELSSHGQALLILCGSSAWQRMYAATMNKDRIIEFVSKPCGPRRLAKALLHCLDKENINKLNAGKASPRDLDVSAEKQEPKSSHGGTFYRTTRPGKVVITAEKLADITDPQSSKRSSSPAMNLSMTAREDANKERISEDLSSPSHSSESDTKQVSSSTTSSRDESGSGNTTPSSSATSATKSISLKPSSSYLSVAENLPLTRRKMLLVEVRNALKVRTLLG